ncbi:MAG: hypothetical protein ABIR57_01505 [Aeromicrobium sp.]
MKKFRSPTIAGFGAIFGLILGGTIVAAVAAPSSTVQVCKTSKGFVRGADSASKCPASSTATTINVKGETGAKGATGPQGPQGPGAVDINFTDNNHNQGRSIILSDPVSVFYPDDLYFYARCTANSVTVGISPIHGGTIAFAGYAAVNHSQLFESSSRYSFSHSVSGSKFISMHGVVTNNSNGKSVGYSIYGRTGLKWCTITGQIIP